MSISINSDLGESLGIHSFGNDDALMDLIDTANVACGFHAGDPGGIRETVAKAAASNGGKVNKLWGTVSRCDKVCVASQAPRFGFVGAAAGIPRPSPENLLFPRRRIHTRRRGN